MICHLSAIAELVSVNADHKCIPKGRREMSETAWKSIACLSFSSNETTSTISFIHWTSFIYQQKSIRHIVRAGSSMLPRWMACMDVRMPLMAPSIARSRKGTASVAVEFSPWACASDRDHLLLAILVAIHRSPVKGRDACFQLENLRSFNIFLVGVGWWSFGNDVSVELDRCGIKSWEVTALLLLLRAYCFAVLS